MLVERQGYADEVRIALVRAVVEHDGQCSGRDGVHTLRSASARATRAPRRSEVAA